MITSVCDKQPYVIVVILCMEEIGKGVSKQSKGTLNQIFFPEPLKRSISGQSWGH